MKEITLFKFHDILYKFFAVLCCLGLFMLAMDLLALANRNPIFLAGQAMTGSYIIIPLLIDSIMIILAYKMAITHLGQAKKAKW